MSALREPRLLRQVLDGLTVQLDGTPAAPSVTSRRRKILHTALEYAVELELLPEFRSGWACGSVNLAVEQGE